MEDLVDVFLEQVVKLHGDKERHTLSDFISLLPVMSEYHTLALQRQLLWPWELEAALFLEEALQKVQKISYIETKITERRTANSHNAPLSGKFTFNVGAGEFKFYAKENELERWKNVLADYIRTAQKFSQKFKMFHEAINNHIELAVLPFDITGEKLYLKQGRLIMPTTIKTPGYHVFSINYEDEKGGILFEPITEYGLSSLEKALKDYVDPKMLGTVAIAKNTEQYPLEETALYILHEKYTTEMDK